MVGSYPEGPREPHQTQFTSEEEKEIFESLKRAAEIEANAQEMREKQKRVGAAGTRGSAGTQEDPIQNIPPLKNPEEVEEEEEPQSQPQLSEEPPVWGDETDWENEPGYHTLSEFEKFCRLGYGEKTLEIAGNRVTVRTISQKEELEALSRADRYPPSARNQAFTGYTMAQAIQAINGRPWFRRIPLNASDDILEEKFQEYLKINPTISAMITVRYQEFERDLQEKVLFAKKDLGVETPSGRTLDESSTKQDNLQQTTPTENS